MTRICSYLCVLALAAPLAAAELQGWQGFRVIHQEGTPERIIAADLDEDGRDELLVVNTRQSRLDVYRWLPPGERSKSVAADADRPNDLPLAPDFRRSEIPLDELPSDVLAADVRGDQHPELLVLMAAAQKIAVLEQDGQQQWKEVSHWDLLPGTPVGRSELMLLRETTGGQRELLVSCEQGIQVVTLELGSRASWLAPRENRSRLDWKLADLDGDGDQDLLEWSNQARQTARWFECVQGSLLPAQVIHEHSVQGLSALRNDSKPAEVLLLGGTQEGLFRRYRLARGEESELGRQESLPMPGGPKAAWCGMLLDERPALVAADASQPRLRVHELSKTGWLGEQSYPTISGVRAMVAPPAEPGTLLLWVKDAADLYASRWNSGRLTYPEALPPTATASERRILALDMAGTTCWWAQRAGADLDLYVWPQGAKQAERMRFPGAGSKTEKVVWLGGKRLLVQQAYAAGAKLIELDGEKLKVSEPAHLAKVDVGEFGLYSMGGELKAGRLTDGVLQWLAPDLHPTDQIMLPDGQRLAGFVPLAENQAWALEQGGAFVDRLKPDEAGIMRVTTRVKPPHGTALRHDAVLGVMLIDQDRVIRLSRGQPVELILIDSIDSRVGRPSGVKEATINRFQVTPISDAHVENVVMLDDRRHQLTILGRTDDGLKPLVSWQVFEDQTYPYGDEKQSQASEPRLVLGFNADGDNKRDLALLCHDRLIVYLAREVP